jgi:hypothetical protein
VIEERSSQAAPPSPKLSEPRLIPLGGFLEIVFIALEGSLTRVMVGNDDGDLFQDRRGSLQHDADRNVTKDNLSPSALTS